MGIKKGPQTNAGRLAIGEANRRRFLRHGQAIGKPTRTYRIWVGIKSRCFKPQATGYAIYGGRGITMCEEWLDFANFYRDMGECPPEFSIDRIDVNGNYKKDNCRWISWTEQRRNCRNTIYISFRGERKSLAEWLDELGFSGQGRRTVAQRLRNGWNFEKAITVPFNKHGPKRRQTERLLFLTPDEVQ